MARRLCAHLPKRDSPAHRHRRVAAVERPVAELTARVPPPAIDPIVGGGAAGVLVPRAHGNQRRRTRHRQGERSRFGRLVELDPRRLEAPAEHGPVRHGSTRDLETRAEGRERGEREPLRHESVRQRARAARSGAERGAPAVPLVAGRDSAAVRLARVDRPERVIPQRPDRRRAVVLRSVSQLAVEVSAPTEHGAVAQEAAGVVHARAHRVEQEVGPNRRRYRSVVRRAISQLTELVPAPAICPSGSRHSARVGHAGRNGDKGKRIHRGDGVGAGREQRDQQWRGCKPERVVEDCDWTCRHVFACRVAPPRSRSSYTGHADLVSAAGPRHPP